MPLLPIDLQTLFSHMNQVGREQAIQREVSPQYQFVQGTEIKRRTEQGDRAVNETHDVGEGLEKVREEKQREKKRQARTKSKKEEDSGSEEGKETFQDPNLGHHVNIIG